MRFYTLFQVLFLYLGIVRAQIGAQSGNWGLQKDGTYRNPIVAGDYSDVDVLHENGAYYLITSTFYFSPGIVILKSTDLLNWESFATIIPNIYTTFNNDPTYNWSGMNQHNTGIYAPSIRKNNGTYYVYTNAFKTGFYYSTATNLAGPWETQPLLDMNGKALLTGAAWDDPCPIWTSDGKAYLVVSKTAGAWYPHLFQMSPDGSKLLDGDLSTMNTSGVFPTDGTIIWDVRTSEGNKYYFWNGYHYFWQTQVLSGSAYRGGFLMRSKNIYGTFSNGTAGSPGNPGTYERKQVINPGAPAAARDPTQGAILQTDCGEWWFITQSGIMGPEGRPISLVPVTWNATDGFPILGASPVDDAGQFSWTGGSLPCSASKSTPQKFPQGSDHFTSTTLHPRWAWNYQPRADYWSLSELPGYLRLKAFKQLTVGNFHKTGNMLVQRYFRSNSIRITVKLSFANFAAGQVGGLAHFAADTSYSFLSVLLPENATTFTPQLLYSSSGANNATATIPQGDTVVYFRSVANYAGNQTFSYSFDGSAYTAIGSSYTLAYSGYRGSLIALFAYNNLKAAGSLDVDSFEYCFDHGFGLTCY